MKTKYVHGTPAGWACGKRIYLANDIARLKASGWIIRIRRKTQ